MPSSNIPRISNIHFDYAAGQQKFHELASNLNEEQKIVYDSIILASNKDMTSQIDVFFGAGGIGKTYLLKTLPCTIRGTYFNQFKLVPSLNETSTSNIKMNTFNAKLIRSAKSIIYNKAIILWLPILL